MKLVTTRRTDYGMQAMIYLAATGAEPGSGQFVHAGDIAAAMDLPVNFLRQVLGDLTRAKLVSSAPSSTGGYVLARPASAISVLEVVEALEGSLRQGECAVRGGPCHWDDVCPLHPVWSEARQALAGVLNRSTLEEVAGTERQLRDGSFHAPADSHRLTEPHRRR